MKMVSFIIVSAYLSLAKTKLATKKLIVGNEATSYVQNLNLLRYSLIRVWIGSQCLLFYNIYNPCYGYGVINMLFHRMGQGDAAQDTTEDD